MIQVTKIIVACSIVFCIGVAFWLMRTSNGPASSELMTVATTTPTSDIVPITEQATTSLEKNTPPPEAAPPRLEPAPVSNKINKPPELEPEPVIENETQVKSDVNGGRAATATERSKMKAAVNEFLTALKSGSEEEVKKAMGYDSVTAEQKAEFDDMSEDEYEFMIGILTDVIGGVPFALDNPNEYQTIITSEGQGEFDVNIQNGVTEEESTETYKLHFTEVGALWIMARPQ